jgi:hypothetical protein
MPMMVLVSMLVLMLLYQTSMGSYYFVYASSVATELQNSVAVFVIWGGVLVLSLTT